MDPCDPYKEVKGRFIGYLSLFATQPESQQMTPAQIQQLCWTCLSTWSCFATLSPELHSLLDLWQAQDAWHQGQVATNPQYDQSSDVSTMFANFFQAANATGAFDRLNGKIAEDTSAYKSMNADLKALNATLVGLPATIDRLSQQANAFRLSLESPQLADEQRVFLNSFLAPLQAELQAAEMNQQHITAMIAQRYPTYMAKFAGISSLHTFGNELMRSFSFFRTDIVVPQTVFRAPSQTNAMYQDYIARYNAIREQPVGFDELSGCVNQYNALNDFAEWSILSSKGQTDTFEVWRSQKLSGQTPTPIVVAGNVSQSVRTVVEAANTAAVASGNAQVAAAIASISPSRASSASGLPVSPAGSESIAPSLSPSSLGSVAADSVSSVSSHQSSVPSTPLGPSSQSVPRPFGGGKKKTRSNHKRSAHKRSAHKHKRSAHKHKRSAHKRSAHKHKKL
jgi:hypothetical protein